MIPYDLSASLVVHVEKSVGRRPTSLYSLFAGMARGWSTMAVFGKDEVSIPVAVG